ncbi:MAG: zinc ribbon domain-containing protein [Acidimicrobiales bacterium]
MATTTFCPSCGAEYLEGAEACAGCGVLLADDALVYEMDGWEEGERAALDELLAKDGIPHRWEDDDLLVPEEHEAAVDALMDRVEFPDALEAVDHEEEDDVDDEAVYAVMSNLFVAADRLAGERAVEVESVADLVTATAEASTTPPPYGVDAVAWSRVQKLAEGIVEALEAEADDEVIVRDAASLRDLLRHYV